MTLGAILGCDLDFGADLNLGGDSVRGATLLPSKFPLLSFYLEILLLYSYFNFLVYILNLLLSLISHLIYCLIILFFL